jgi:hypothetical protein
MKRRGLLAATVLALLLTSMVLVHTGRASDPRSAKIRHSFSGETALRYRQGQPSHWRAYLLQH